MQQRRPSIAENKYIKLLKKKKKVQKVEDLEDLMEKLAGGFILGEWEGPQGSLFAKEAAVWG